MWNVRGLPGAGWCHRHFPRSPLLRQRRSQGLAFLIPSSLRLESWQPWEQFSKRFERPGRTIKETKEPQRWTKCVFNLPGPECVIMLFPEAATEVISFPRSERVRCASLVWRPLAVTLVVVKNGECLSTDTGSWEEVATLPWLFSSGEEGSGLVPERTGLFLPCFR